MRGLLRTCRKWVARYASRIQTRKRLRRDSDEAHAARFKVLEVLNGRVEELMIGVGHGEALFHYHRRDHHCYSCLFDGVLQSDAEPNGLLLAGHILI